jgi:hypothetical protein
MPKEWPQRIDEVVSGAGSFIKYARIGMKI